MKLYTWPRQKPAPAVGPAEAAVKNVHFRSPCTRLNPHHTHPAVLFFGNKLTTQTQIGTAVALIGTWLYTEASKKKPAPKTA